MCQSTEKWMEAIPTIFLGFRAYLRENIGSTSAEMMYEKTLRLSGEVFDNTQADSDPIELDKHFRHHLQQLKPEPSVSHAKPAVFVHTN
ncbi:hypothetical protein NPIL_354131 [Nephila pilipes]|uniref:Uncharacterized protein n=1 Tax=Nephila pilipes TaxID=299642 RepID=A0A8X6QD29_NEPPI|nr:hypothetical protein NPIL_354131 [Nephila pilipes]